MKVCPKCSYSAICISDGFEVIFNALALQHAAQWLATADLTKDIVRIKRSARLVVRAVQEVLPIGCPNVQKDCLLGVLMGANGGGPVVDVVVENPF